MTASADGTGGFNWSRSETANDVSDSIDNGVEDEATPLVTIVIPFLRGGNFLDEAIESVHRQTYRHWEIMLVDNGCKGGAPEVARQDPRIKVLQERRRGVTFARNAGILASRAEFVAFLDEDDRWLPTKLAEQVMALRATPAAVLCHTSHQVIDADGMPIGVSPPKLAESYEDLLGFRGGMLPSTTMVRRKALDEVGLFDHDRPTVEDYDLFLRLLKDGSAVVLRESMMEYRWHQGQSSRDYAASFKMTIRILRLARRIAISERRVDRFVLSLRGEAATRKGYGDLAFDLARQGRRDGQSTTAVMSHFLFGMRTFPFGIRTFFRSRRVTPV